MTGPPRPGPLPGAAGGQFAGALLLCAGLLLAGPGWAQATAAAPGVDQRDGSPSWSSLRPEQRTALAPLRAEWHRLDDPQRLKWIAVADRFPTMSPAERERMQSRMQEWAGLSPEQRGVVRQRYQQAQGVDPAERRARWQEFQSLSPEERRQWAERSAGRSGTGDSRPAPKPADPLAVRGGSGATTRPLDALQRPPGQPVPTTPRIAVSPSLVDPSTLLPRSGPQAAPAARRDERGAGGNR